jgi:hypothetical protein
MEESLQKQIPLATRAPLSTAKVIVIKIIILVLLGVLLGLAQGWASSSRFYSPDRLAGFHSGVMQGILMPAAMPALLMGSDLPIYAPNNTGRVYKIGYCFGVNICGTVFFGVAFWHPRKRKSGM